jgi:predicted TPR repeat methyltransferase
LPRGALLVLDVGCGSGMMGRFLSENNGVVDGVDIDH